MKLDPEFVIENEKMLLGQYPNTYTFTKSMAERAIMKKRGSLPVSIVRPSIIISSYEEPVQGWTDTLAAGGVLVLALVNGYLTTMNLRREPYIDFVPVDLVSNIILASTAYTGLSKTPGLNVVHATTSQLNPISVGSTIDALN